jgi:hypothetical protein
LPKTTDPVSSQQPSIRYGACIEFNPRHKHCRRFKRVISPVNAGAVEAFHRLVGVERVFGVKRLGSVVLERFFV